jgi:hypothetical protein
LEDESSKNTTPGLRAIQKADKALQIHLRPMLGSTSLNFAVR